MSTVSGAMSEVIDYKVTKAGDEVAGEPNSIVSGDDVNDIYTIDPTEIDLVYRGWHTLAKSPDAGHDLTLDLQALITPEGETINITKVRRILLSTLTKNFGVGATINLGNIHIGNGTNPFFPWSTTKTAIMEMLPNERANHIAYTNGLATSPTEKTLRLENQDTVNINKILVMIWGSST